MIATSMRESITSGKFIAIELTKVFQALIARMEFMMTRCKTQYSR
jgi:hypothetical protein